MTLLTENIQQERDELWRKLEEAKNTSSGFEMLVTTAPLMGAIIALDALLRALKKSGKPK